MKEKDKKMAERQKAAKVEPVVPAAPADSVAPEATLSDGDRAFLNEFRITPETFASDTKERWEAEWDRVMAEGSESERVVLETLFSREGGIKYYVDIEWSAADEVMHPQVLVNMCHFLYLSDPDALKKDWIEVEELYVAIRDGTPLPEDAMAVDADAAADADASEASPKPMSIGAPAKTPDYGVSRADPGFGHVDADTPEGMPRWTGGDWRKWRQGELSTADKQALMITSKRVIKSFLVGAGGAFVGMPLAAYLVPMAASWAVSAGVSAAASSAIGATVGALSYGVGAKISDVAITAAAHHGSAMLTHASSLLYNWESSLALTDYATYEEVYSAMAEKEQESIALWLMGKGLEYTGKTKEEVEKAILKIPSLGVEGGIHWERAGKMFKQAHLRDTNLSHSFLGLRYPMSSDGVTSEVASKAAQDQRISLWTAWKSWRSGTDIEDVRAADARAMFERRADAPMTSATSGFLGRMALRVGIAIPGSFVQQRYVKDEVSIQWLKNTLDMDGSAFTYSAGLDERLPLTTFDFRLRNRHEEICKTSDAHIKAYLKADRSRKPYGSGILKEDTQNVQLGPNQGLTDGKVGDELVTKTVSKINRLCTKNPDEERVAVIEAYTRVLEGIKQNMRDLKGREWKRENGWWKIAIKPVMMKLEPWVDKWLELDERLFKNRFLRDIPGEEYRKASPEEYTRRLNDEDNPCKQFMEDAARERQFGPRLSWYGQLKAQDAIDNGREEYEVQENASDEVYKVARFYGFSKDDANKYAGDAAKDAKRLYEAHEKQKKAGASKRLRDARAVNLEKAKKDAQEAGDKVVDALLYDESVTDDELAKQVVDAAYDAAISYPSVAESVVLKLSYKAAEAAIKKRNKVAAERAKQRAKEDAEDQRKEKRRTEALRKQQEREERAEKAAEKKAQDAAKKAAAKAAAAEEEREKAPEAVMNLAEAKAAARLKAWSIINELLENDADVDPVELEGLAAMAAADEVRRIYTDMPARVIRQVGLEAASAARQLRGDRAAGNDGRDPNEPQLAPLGGGAGPVFGAGEAMDALGTGASASVVADVFARLSL